MPRLRTTMFEIIRGRGMTIEGFARVGEYRYSSQYLRLLARGLRAVPDSSEFQEWVAEILGLPASILFFVDDLADANAELAESESVA